MKKFFVMTMMFSMVACQVAEERETENMDSRGGIPVFSSDGNSAPYPEGVLATLDYSKTKKISVEIPGYGIFEFQLLGKGGRTKARFLNTAGKVTWDTDSVKPLDVIDIDVYFGLDRDGRKADFVILPIPHGIGSLKNSPYKYIVLYKGVRYSNIYYLLVESPRAFLEIWENAGGYMSFRMEDSNWASDLPDDLYSFDFKTSGRILTASHSLPDGISQMLDELKYEVLDFAIDGVNGARFHLQLLNEDGRTRARYIRYGESRWNTDAKPFDVVYSSRYTNKLMISIPDGLPNGYKYIYMERDRDIPGMYGYQFVLNPDYFEDTYYNNTLTLSMDGFDYDRNDDFKDNGMLSDEDNIIFLP